MSIKTTLRDAIARLLFLAHLTDPGRRGRGHLSIATFHRVLPKTEREAYPFPGLVVTPEELDLFLGYFTRYFDCGSLATQHERYLSGERTSRPLLAVTFDDGQYDNHRYAAPVLAKHDVKASFFIPVVAVEQQELLWHDRLGFAVLALLSGAADGQQRVKEILAAAGLSAEGHRSLVENTVQSAKQLGIETRLSAIDMLTQASDAKPAPEFARLMTFDEIAGLAAAGHEIGSHSMTHCLMPECADPELHYELAESRRILQARLALPINSFCYPNGNCDARTAEAVKMAGYHRAITTVWGNNGPTADCFRLCRFDMVARHVSNADGRFSPALLAFRTSGYYPGLR